LQPVDTLVYEQDMGMSGWVGGRRVLIGNRRLLENHGVDVPSRDYEQRYVTGDRQIVYLSIAGELSAMFVVSYVADAGIAAALGRLNRSGITLLVRTCDPNVTEALICRVYNLNSYYVEVMSAPAGRCYEALTVNETPEEEAVLATNGRLEGLATALSCCRNLFGRVRLTVLVQMIWGVVGLLLGVLLLFQFQTPLVYMPLVVLVYQLVGAVLTWLVPMLRRL